MATRPKPTIKGIFVRSHIAALRAAKGPASVRELEKRYGRPLKFKNSDNVPVHDEVKLIEQVLDLMSNQPVPPAERAFEAGRLHFRNFTTTPLAKIVFSVYRQELKRVLMSAASIAGHVFQGVDFTSEELGPTAVRITLQNNDYPLDHFRGLFDEWIRYSGHKGSVNGTESADGSFVYDLHWDAQSTS